MIKNYLKTAIRALLKNKGYSVINILGLAIGMTSCVLIFLYVSFELSYDNYHENSDRIFRVAQFEESANHTSTDPITAPPLAPTLKKDYPEVEVAARIFPSGPRLVRYEDNFFIEERIYGADNEIFDIFKMEFIEGDPGTALDRPQTLVITRKIKERYFGEEKAVGKTLKMNTRNYEITGVIENLPANTHLKFNCLYALKFDVQPAIFDNWVWHNIHTYIKLKPNTDNKSFESKMSKVGDAYAKEVFDNMGYSYTFFLQPVSSLHLYPCPHSELESPGNPSTLYIFSFIAFIILIIACVNFINLNTARSSNRAKEIGIRKVVGSKRSQLIRQFIGESLLMAIFSALLSLLIIDFCLPLLNNITDLDFILDDLFKPQVISLFIILILFSGIISGIYPAIYLSAFIPVNTIKKQTISNTRSPLRKIIVVFQFCISVLLIISTIVANRQLEYMKNSDLGFNNKLKVVIPVRGGISISENYEMIKDEFLKIPSITGATVASEVPGDEVSMYYTELMDQDNNKSQSIDYIHIDTDFISEMEINIIAGRGFSPDMSSDSTFSYLINESALDAFGWDKPETALGKRLEGVGHGEIIGVVDNFYYRGMQREVGPLIMTSISSPYKNIILNISPENIEETLEQIEKKWEEIYPGNPYYRYFLEDNFNRQYLSEEKISKIFTGFTGLGIFIACLGLLGLASFTSEQRTKEIGIRKVLGSSVNSIVLLLSKEFSKWVLIATIIAWPIAWFVMNKWLSDFANKTDLRWWIFLASGGLALLIALLTVSYQALRVAIKNPADSLKYE